MERYLNITEARKGLLGLVERLKRGDRVVITKHGRPKAVLVNFERYALLEDLAWVLQHPGRQAALHQAWDELQRGKMIRPPKRGPLTVRALRSLARQPSRRRARA
jgi:prevent-host-death family protein